MKLSISLIGTIRLSLSILFLLLAGILTYFLVGDEIRNTQAQINTIHSTFVNKQKELILTQVRHAVDYVRYQRTLAEKRIRVEAKNRVEMAVSSAKYIIDRHRNLSEQEIKQRLADVLYPMSWDDGQGYYFVQDLNGKLIFNRNNPELEGKNVTEVLDSKGASIFKTIRSIVLSPAKEGFLTYYWNVPGRPGINSWKVAYVKLFEPLGWIIATGKYIHDEEEKIKTEVIDRIEHITYGEDGYIFIGTYDGTSLSGPSKGKNMYDFTDPNGTRVVEELIKASRNGGGFVQYVAPGFKGKPPRPKISYAEPMDDWNWYIGTGVYMDSVDKQVQEKQSEMKGKLRSLVMKALTFLLLFWCFSLLFIGYLSRKIQGNISGFIKFFKQSAIDAQPIDNSKISFTEFQILARYANEMSAQREKSEEKYKHLFNNTPAGVYEIDLQSGRFININDYLCEYIGYTREELMDLPPINLLSEGCREKFLMRYQEMISKKEPNDYMEYNVIKKNGEIFTAVFRSEFIYQNDMPVSVRVVVTDISRLKKMEAMVVQSDKMTSLGGMALGMAHEINNPLAGMIQNAQLIQQRLSADLPANQAAAQALDLSFDQITQYIENRQIFTLINHIVQAGGKAAQIIENILSFANRSDVSKKRQDITQIIDDAVQLAKSNFDLQKHHDFKTIQIRKEYESHLPDVSCDAGKIKLAFFNLLKNASESIAARGESEDLPSITLRASLQDSFVRIEIEDNGIGIDPALKKRLFEPFFTTKGVDEGVGLGLSISYFIVVNDHGGSLEVESQKGEGAIFIINLPV